METKALTHNQALGAYGEALAAGFLTRQGMVLLDSNWRCPQGEIDLVLRDGRTLVVCEVKTRSSNDFGTPHEAIDRRKVDRLRRLAAAGCASTPCIPTASVSTSSPCSVRARASRRSTTCGGWSDVAGHCSLRRPGRDPGSPHRCPGRHLGRHARDLPRGTSGQGDPGGPRPGPDGDQQRGPAVARDPQGHHPAGARRPAQARHALRPGDRRRREGRRPVSAPRRCTRPPDPAVGAGRHRVHR